jgi:hypothetical protein
MLGICQGCDRRYAAIVDEVRLCLVADATWSRLMVLSSTVDGCQQATFHKDHVNISRKNLESALGTVT